MLIKTLKKSRSNKYIYELRWEKETSGFFPSVIFADSEVIETAPTSEMKLADIMVQNVEKRIQKIRDEFIREATRSNS